MLQAAKLDAIHCSQTHVPAVSGWGKLHDMVHRVLASHLSTCPLDRQLLKGLGGFSLDKCLRQLVCLTVFPINYFVIPNWLSARNQPVSLLSPYEIGEYTIFVLLDGQFFNPGLNPAFRQLKFECQ